MRRKTSAPSSIKSPVLIDLDHPDELDRVDELIDWPKIAGILDGLRDITEGGAYSLLTMIKIIVLQRWFTAPNAGMEYALSDRLSFRRFAGLSLQDGTPDHSLISLFRSEVRARRLEWPLFAEVSRQLKAQEALVKGGTLTVLELVKTEEPRPQSEAEDAQRDE